MYSDIYYHQISNYSIKPILYDHRHLVQEVSYQYSLIHL